MLEINIKRYLKITHTFTTAMWHLPREIFDLATESLNKVKDWKNTEGDCEKKAFKWEINIKDTLKTQVQMIILNITNVTGSQSVLKGLLVTLEAVRTWLLISLAFSVPLCGVGRSLPTSLPADTGELGRSQILDRAFQFSQTVRWVLFLSTWFLFFQKLGHLICTNMDGPRDCHTEWSKTDSEGEISYDIPYMWDLKRNDTDKLTYKTERDSKT